MSDKQSQVLNVLLNGGRVHMPAKFARMNARAPIKLFDRQGAEIRPSKPMTVRTLLQLEQQLRVTSVFDNTGIDWKLRAA